MEKKSDLIHDTNIAIFKFFNELFGKPEFDPVMVISDKIGSHQLFYYYFISAFVIASFTIYINRNNIDTTKELVISWVTAAITLLSSLIIGYIIITLIKNYTNISRPFCSMEDIYILPMITDMLDCKMSFPSGHISFLTIMIVSFWSLFNYQFKILSIFLLIVVAITRMTSGSHYPMDLFGAVVIMLPLTAYIHHKVAHYILHYEGKYDVFNELYSKIRK